MTYITRAQSGIPGATDGNTVSAAEKTRFVVHWDGGANPKMAADEITLLLAYIRHHISQGWEGPAYNLGVGPITGNVYELRGLAAVGTHAPGANRNGIGVILIGGPGNLTENGKQGLRDAYALACAFAGRVLTQEVHSDVVATQCPGEEIREWVHNGGLTSQPPKSPQRRSRPGDEMELYIDIDGTVSHLTPGVEIKFSNPETYNTARRQIAAWVKAGAADMLVPPPLEKLTRETAETGQFVRDLFGIPR